jgi:hypothetical protein
MEKSSIYADFMAHWNGQHLKNAGFRNHQDSVEPKKSYFHG